MKIYDSHCHPNLEPLSDKFDEIILDAKENNLFMNVVGVDLNSSIKAVEIAKKYPDYFAACIAIHPNDVQSFDYDLAKKELYSICEKNLDYISAIGECGLDFYYSVEHKDNQYKFLKMQTELAIKYNLPLMLHVRNAHLEIIDYLKNEKLNISVIFHCFSENVEIAKKILELSKTTEIYFSIPGIVTFKNAKALQEAIKIIPLDMMLSETDSPWLAPEPYRGKMNKPLYVLEVIKKIAFLKNIDLQTVADKVYSNAKKIFI